MRKTLLIWGLIFALRPAIVQAADPSLFGIPLPPPIPPGTSAPYEFNGDLCVRPDLQGPLTELLLWTKEYPQVCADIMEAREKHADAIRANAIADKDRQIETLTPHWWKIPVIVAASVLGGYLLGKVL